MINQLYKQKIQLDENRLPYHYADLIVEESRLVWEIERTVLIKILKHRLLPFKGQRILDAGCGDGRFCFELKDEKADVVGMDFSQKAIAFAKAFNPSLTFRVVNLEKIPGGIKGFDQIICQEILEHIPLQKVSVFLKNLDNLLNPGGMIIFTVPSKKLRIPVKHFQHFDEKSLNKILNSKFTVKEITGYNITSYKRSIFLIMKYIVSILLPFRKKYKSIYIFCDYLRNYYEQNLAIGNPNDGLGIIAICQKKS